MKTTVTFTARVMQILIFSGQAPKKNQLKLYAIPMERFDCKIGCDGPNIMILIGIWRHAFLHFKDCHNIKNERKDGKCQQN